MLCYAIILYYCVLLVHSLRTGALTRYYALDLGVNQKT
jgi:hypothetical protein